MATAGRSTTKFCKLVQLEQLYILCPLAEALSLIASERDAKISVFSVSTLKMAFVRILEVSQKVTLQLGTKTGIYFVAHG